MVDCNVGVLFGGGTPPVEQELNNEIKDRHNNGTDINSNFFIILSF